MDRIICSILRQEGVVFVLLNVAYDVLSLVKLCLFYILYKTQEIGYSFDFLMVGFPEATAPGGISTRTQLPVWRPHCHLWGQFCPLLWDLVTFETQYLSLCFSPSWVLCGLLLICLHIQFKLTTTKRAYFAQKEDTVLAGRSCKIGLVWLWRSTVCYRDGWFLADKDCGTLKVSSCVPVESDTWCADPFPPPLHFWTGEDLGWGWLGGSSLSLPPASSGLMLLFQIYD